MFLWGIITGIFWAIVITIVLWVLCAYTGRLVNSSFRPTIVHHLICLVIAIPTIILLSVVFTLNKVNRIALQVDTYIGETLSNNQKFVKQLQQQINQAVSTSDTEDLTEYLTQNYSENILEEYPMLGKYLDTENLQKSLNIEKQISGISQNAGVNQIQKVIQSTASNVTGGIRSKIRSVRRKALIAVVLLQAIAFGVVMYQANKYRKPSNFSYYSNSDDFI